MLEVVEGVQLVSTFMEVVFRVDVANQMSVPTGGAVEEVIDLQSGEDVKDTIMPSGSVSIEDTSFVKLPKAQDFTAGRSYSVRFSFSDADNKLAGELRLDCPF